MFKFVVLSACVVFAQAGLLASPGGISYASGPSLGAPLLGRTTINAPEVNIVKQQVVVDQPEIRYRAVPTIVQAPPVIQTVQVAPQPQVVQYAAPQPQVVQYAAPQPQVVQYAAPQPQVVQYAPQLTYSAPAVRTVGLQTVAAPLAASSLAIQAPLALNSWSNSVIASPSLLLKK